MKLSTLKRTAWGVALLSATGSSYLSYAVVRHSLDAKPKTVQATEFSNPVVSDLIEKERMNSQQILTALYDIIHVEPPPPPPEPEVTEPEPASAEVVEEAPPPPPPPSTYQVKFIAYDASEKARHMVFIYSEKHNWTRPFLQGEKIDSSGAYISEIFPTLVLIRLPDGQLLELRPDASETPSSVVNLPPANAVAKVISSPEPPPKPVIEKPKTNQFSPAELKALKYRTTPKKRVLTHNDSYGIDVIEYDPDENSKVRRFAINEADKKVLESSQLRLMSEVAPELVTNDSGQPRGIKANFQMDNPLLKQFGIRDGDILTSINDQPVRSQSDVQRIYDTMDQRTRRVKLGIERGGQNLKVLFEMDDYKSVPTTINQPKP